MRIAFEDCEIDTVRFELRRAGDLVKLEPQVFDLIALLARKAGNLVTREELVQSVWQGRIVNEATIDARVAAARRALGDDGKHQRIIKTVPRRGFRFLGEVSKNASAGHPVETENQRTTANRAFTQPVVAVLPFRDLYSSLPEDPVFAEGISEDITTELSRFHAILVTSRMSSFQFRASDLPPKEIAKKLGADFILSGTVRRAANRIRVVVELYEAREDRQIWSERFDRPDEDIFAVLDEISGIVASRMTGQVQFAETRRTKAKDGHDLTAYEALLVGLDLHKSGDISPEVAKRAVSAFSKAIDADPDFARAYAWRACSFSRTWGFPVQRAQFDRVSEDVFKALELDPGEAEAHRIAGAVCRALHEFDRATSHIEKALELNPSDTHIAAKSAEHFAFIGEPQRARELIEKAMALNPMFPSWYWEIIALAEYVDGNYEEALAAITRATNPTFAGFAYQVGSEVKLDRPHEARGSVKLLKEQYPDVNLAVYQRDGRRFAFSDEATHASFVKALAISGLD